MSWDFYSTLYKLNTGWRVNGHYTKVDLGWNNPRITEIELLHKPQVNAVIYLRDTILHNLAEIYYNSLCLITFRLLQH